MQNNEGVFWGLIEEHRASLWQYALALTRSRDDAKDLVSETVLAAHTSFPQLHDIKGFRKSIYTIASRIYKRKKWRSKIFTPLESVEQYEGGGIAESSHDLELLMKALALLPPKQKEAVLLFEIAGLSLEEIREVQGGTLSGVKSRVKRGREELTRLMSDGQKVFVLTDRNENFFEMSMPSMTLN
jgi:RNA polymerase sigma-70 factor (ECF subfamily)